jgi:hypothetical protein
LIPLVVSGHGRRHGISTFLRITLHSAAFWEHLAIMIPYVLRGLVHILSSTLLHGPVGVIAGGVAAGKKEEESRESLTEQAHRVAVRTPLFVLSVQGAAVHKDAVLGRSRRALDPENV